MRDCGCYYCRIYGECDELRHPPAETINAKHKDGMFYWGPEVNEAKGRWVKLCQDCVDAFEEGDGVESEQAMEAAFFPE